MTCSPNFYGPLNLGAVVNVVTLELGEHGSVALPAGLQHDFSGEIS